MIRTDSKKKDPDSDGCFLGEFLFHMDLRSQISVSAGWNLTIDANDLIQAGTPGSNLNGTSLSSTDTNITMNISFGVNNYTVYASRTDSSGWPSGWALAVRRTSNGIGFGSITGGTNFVTIPNNLPPYGPYLYNGNGWRFLIGIELQLSSVTINSALAATTFGTRVTCTLTQP
jgi:hypothetical protein